MMAREKTTPPKTNRRGTILRETIRHETIRLETGRGHAVAARALALVGTPFKLGGRDPADGIDCIGLAALALDRTDDLPGGYRLNAGDEAPWETWFAAHGFDAVESPALPGDVYLVAPGPLHRHLLIVVRGGFVHAHAGLRRTVFLPGCALPEDAPPWPVLSLWHERSL